MQTTLRIGKGQNSRFCHKVTKNHWWQGIALRATHMIRKKKIKRKNTIESEIPTVSWICLRNPKKPDGYELKRWCPSEPQNGKHMFVPPKYTDIGFDTSPES